MIELTFNIDKNRVEIKRFDGQVCTEYYGANKKYWEVIAEWCSICDRCGIIPKIEIIKEV